MYTAKHYLALTAMVVGLFCFNITLFASETDDRIEAEAKQSYVFNMYLIGDDVTIRSREGVVTLTGTVSSEPYKLLAREMAASLPGVISVDNQLVAKDKAPGSHKDAWLVTKVRSTLMFHRNLNATAIKVAAKDGTVTLSEGQAISAAQKNLATEYAEDVEGVRKVVNEMSVLSPPMRSDESTNSEPMDDASITALVKMTLLYHRSTSALNAAVETKDGAVTLGDKAGSEAEKDRATKLVSDVHGVKTVVNNMTVEGVKDQPQKL
jgi:osmotically-inducible protein OsmY